MATRSDSQSQAIEKTGGCSEQSVKHAPHGYSGPRSFWCDVLGPIWGSYFEKTSWDRGEFLEGLRHALEQTAQTADQKGQPLPPNDELQKVGSLATDVVESELLKFHGMFLEEAYKKLNMLKRYHYIESKMWRIIEELFRMMVSGLVRHATGGKGDQNPTRLWNFEERPLREYTNYKLESRSKPTPCGQQPDTPNKNDTPSTCGKRWDLLLNPLWLEFIDLVVSECHDLWRLNDFVGRAYARGERMVRSFLTTPTPLSKPSSSSASAPRTRMI